MRLWLKRWWFEVRFDYHCMEDDRPFWIHVLHCVWIEITLIAKRVWCGIAGHSLVDDDPGDAEVGPQPDINCVRCYRSF